MMKKVIATVLFTSALLLMLSAVAFAAEQENESRSSAENGVLESSKDAPNPSYILKWDYDQEEGGMIDLKIVFPDGTMDEPGDDYVMLMSDGSFVSSSFKLIDNAVNIPIGLLAQKKGAEVAWDNASKTASFVFPGGVQISVTAGSDIADVDREKTKLDFPARLINDRLYVPLTFIKETFAEINEHPVNDSFAKYPIVIIETETADGTAETKAVAEKSAEEAISKLFEEFIKEYGEKNEYAGYDYGLSDRKELMGSPVVSGEISRYWILKDAHGEDMLLRDKYNGNMYIFRGNYNTYWIEPLTFDSFYRVFFTE